MRRHILHVIPHLWSGAGGVLTRLCEAQRRSGRVTIVTGGGKGENPDWPEYRARLRRARVTQHTVDFYQRSEFWKSTAQLADLVRELKPTVIHAHAGAPCAASAIARATTGSSARLVGQMYCWGPDRADWMNQQDLWGFAQSDRVVCSARAYWDLLVGSGVPKRKLVYLPWGLPLERLPFSPRIGSDQPRAGYPHTKSAYPLRVGFVGRVEPRKAQLELVLAFERLRHHYPGARLDLVGPIADKSYAARVRAAINRGGLKGAVKVHGEVSEIHTYVREWDLFVSLSLDEGQGLAVLEAMAIGVPVLARPVAGIADFLVQGRTGIAIKDGDVKTAALTMLRASRVPKELSAMAGRARAMVEREYDWRQTVAAFERIYRR